MNLPDDPFEEVTDPGAPPGLPPGRFGRFGTRILRSPLWKRRWAQIGVAAAAALVVLLIVAASTYRHYAKGLPSIEWALNYRPPIVSQIWSADGQLIGEYYDERRIVVPFEKIPHKLAQAFIASEDADFFDHPGYSLTGIVRAAFKSYVLRRHMQGGSTITQQTAKAILVSTEGLEEGTKRSLKRKIRELILARRLEKNLPKQRILELYLNEVFLGHHSYGVQAAAENYFRKNVWELTLPEMALIAGLPQAPSHYSPFAHPDKARARRSYVLGRMLANGMISRAEHDAADAAPIVVYPVEEIQRETAPYFSEQVRRDIVARYENETLLREGLEIDATVDVEREKDAVAATLKGILDVDKRQGFFGPLDKIKKEQWDEFRKKEEAVLPKEKLGEDVYAALVTKVDKDGQSAQVAVGPFSGTLPIDFARWGRKPNPELWAEGGRFAIKTLTGVLAPGDAILVRPVLPEGTSESFPRRGSTARPPAKDEYVFALEQDPHLQGSLISLDPQSGYITAMIGGYDFERSEFNRAIQACRQPGSAFKPVIYSAAIEEKGFTASTILVDSPIVTDDEETGKRWKPNNYEETFEGEVPVRKALVWSMNIPAIKTLQQVGVREAAAWAHKLGISSPICWNRETGKEEPNLSMALGSSCVTLWELTKVFAVFNRGGTKVEPVYIRRVRDRDGRTLEDHSSFDDMGVSFGERVASGYAKLFENPERAMLPQTAFLMTHLMEEVAKYGTGARAQALGKPVAGKTGTTNDLFDAWFMGFTHDVVTGVWVGYDSYDTPMDKYEAGGHTALPIWLDYMQRALKGRPQEPFEVPEKIAWVDIDGETGKRATPATRNPIHEAYLEGTEPPDLTAPGAVKPAIDPQEGLTRGGL